MPRPQKWRNVCAMPRCNRFSPRNGGQGGVVEMTVDEYEAVRLIDLEGLTQEQCAGQMHVARTTVQAIYRSARKKLADCIVNGRPLVIGGGEYRICGHHDGCRGRRHCHGQSSPQCAGEKDAEDDNAE